MRAHRLLVIPLMLMLFVAAFACNEEGESPAAGDGAARVAAIEGEGDPRTAWGFAPEALTVAAGAEITFANDGAEAHTATADNGAFDTGTISAGDARTVTLDAPGTYTYHCTLHPWMTGTITVEES